MNSVSEDKAGNGTYVFNAPPKASPDQGNEVTTMIGILCSCIMITAVLFFLWKLLQRKQNEMRQFQEEPEHGKNAEDGDSSSLSVGVSTEQSPEVKTNGLRLLDKIFKTSTVDREQSSSSFKNDKFEAMDKDLDELILPPLSPIISSTWSEKRQQSPSEDTGCDSGFGRFSFAQRDGGILRTGKLDNDLEIEHTSDILTSLVRERQALRQESEARNSKIKKVIELLDQCSAFVRSAREKASEESKTDSSMQRFLRKMREERRRYDSIRRFPRKSVWKQRENDSRDAFISMQTWFDGLRLHPNLMGIAEEVFLLRSHHRSDVERNDAERKCVRGSVRSLDECSRLLSRARRNVADMKRQIAERKKAIEQANRIRKERDKKINALFEMMEQNSENVNCDDRKAVKRRVTLPKKTGRSLAQNPCTRVTSLNAEKCSECQKYYCRCEPFSPEEGQTTDSLAVKATDFKTEHTERVNGVESSETKNRLLNRVVQTDENETSFNLILNLKEITQNGVPGYHDNSEDLSEREVTKALKRVPNIKCLKSIKKGTSGEWTIEAIASQGRIANIKFNCRGKNYAIEMKKNLPKHL
ncbi:unnamed protein product [Clavelina lepadiformis]|uniref:Uncharacterized protein n=1 Tax=Clavelina lepadiformis TaxID=159417 RepID=A0ABP0EZ83_CLALP